MKVKVKVTMLLTDIGLLPKDIDPGLVFLLSDDEAMLDINYVSIKPRIDASISRSLYVWLDDNTPGWYLKRTPDGVVVVFEVDSDAVHFRMRWR